jgi:hypothetical protein
MANNPNDPKKPQPDPKSGQPRPEDAELPDSVPFGAQPQAFHSPSDEPGSLSEGELPTLPPSGSLSDPELYLHDPRRAASDSSSGEIPTVNPRATPESAIFENLKGSPPDSALFESLKKPDSGDDSLFNAPAPTGESPSFTSGSSILSNVPTAQPASGSAIRKGDDPDAAVGNYEPPSPVAPASGWLDTPEPPPSGIQRSGPLGVEEADLFEAPPVVESSDIFSSGASRAPKPPEGSDVIAATSGGPEPAKPGTPDRASDIALSFDQPPGGSTIESAVGSGELPVADEVPSNSSLFDSPQYGATPASTEDASSILADLSDPGDVTINDSSAIRLDSPGVPRTHHPSSGTEFDLTIGEGEIPPELAEAAEAAEAGEANRPKRPASDPDTRTVPEINVDEGRVKPIDTRLRPDDPSSIFDSINDPVVFRRPGDTQRTSDDDIAVEFSDHPDEKNKESSSSSSLFGPAKPAAPGRKPSARPKSEADFQLPAEPADPAETTSDSGVLDWRAKDVEPPADSSDILVRGGRPPEQRTEPITDRTGPTRTAPVSRPPRAPAGPPRSGTGLRGKPGGTDSVEVDWVAGSSADAPAMATEPREHEPVSDRTRERPIRAAAPRKQGGLIGGFIGAGIAVAACTGIYLSGAIPNKKPTTAAPIQTVAANNTGKNDESATNPVDQPPPATVPGQARLFAKVQQMGRVNAPVAAADDADLRRAREELRGVADNAEAAKTPRAEWEAVQAMIYLGVSHQIANEREAARKVYEEGKKKFPKYAATFQGALDRLDATETRPGGVSRLTPLDAEQLLLAVVLLQAEPPAKPEPEAGDHFWKAVKLARSGQYAEAGQAIELAKAAHVKQAKASPGGGLNPLSDPLHEIFPRACDDLKAYWDLRAAIYSNKAVAELMKKDGPDKALSELAKRANAAVTLMAEVKSANDKLTKAQADYKDASDKLAKAQGDYKNASEKLTKSEKELTGVKDDAVKFEKEYRVAEEARLTIERKLKEEATARSTAEAARKKGDELIAAMAKELQAAKLLPDKFDDSALLAAQKSAAARASDTKLSAVIEAETKALKDAHAVEVKKLTDAYAAESKKLMDAHAATTTKLKDEQAAELKKASDRFAADLKKLNESHDARVKALEAAVAEEKKAAEALVAKHKIDLGAAMSPAQALDVWLPLLTDLRRPSDADPALATATKVLATYPADSEDAAKARTVAGLAHFLRGDMVKAREMFIAAQSSPAYRAAAGKPWARSADVGLQAIDDPLATLRRPVEARKIDARAAARHLDAGVKSYKAGRYAEAAAALAESVKADPSDPVAWYFLGAARWETTGAAEARKEFEQGAEQERNSNLTARAIGDRLAPIQGPARDALTAARP